MKRLDDGIMPEDIKKMTLRELELLSDEIRDRLITTVSSTGGHLASNLGMVELTIAIHRVFDMPKDRIVFDVGHQSYVHKLLTGRAGRFDTLRQYGGLSGFPKRSESVYDVFDTGHSSNSISAALGMAVARDLTGGDYCVGAVIGDGALTGGMAYEALNNAGVMDTNIIVILNDNAMSISEDNGGMSMHLSRLRSSEQYLWIKNNIKKTLKDIPKVGKKLFHVLQNMRNALKYTLVKGVLFEELGFTYLGPVNGHDLTELTDVLTSAKHLKEPVLVHCMTVKGKGYRPAEKNPSMFHGVSPFDRETGCAISGGGRNYSDVFAAKLTDMASKDSRITVIAAAMVNGTGLSVFAKKHPNRIFDVGIAEEHAVTFAAGLAAEGMRPVVAIYSTFLQRAYDQILIDVCMQNLPVMFCIDRAGVVGADGETHNGIFDISYLMHMPNMTILAPSDTSTLELMLEYGMTLKGPCAIRYPKSKAENLPDCGTDCESSKKWQPLPFKLRTGSDITVICVGTMAGICMRACEELGAKYGISCELIDARIIKPLPEEALEIYRISAKKTGRLLIVEDNVKYGGFGACIAELFSNDPNIIKIERICWPDAFIEQGSREELMGLYGLGAPGVIKKVCDMFEREA